MEKAAAIESAVAAEKLLGSSATNIRRTLENTASPIAAQSIAELIEAGAVDGIERPLLSFARFRDRRHSRAHHRQGGDRRGARHA